MQTHAIHFLSFGSGPFHGAVRRIADEAQTMNVTNIHVYDETTLPDDFHQRYESFVRRAPRGYAYWLWKPYLTLYTLQNHMQDGDTLVYCDAGCMLNTTPRGSDALAKAVQAAQVSPCGMLAFATGHVEYKWTKIDLLDFLDVSPQHRNTNQLIATGFVICKTPRSVQVVEDWLSIASRDNHHYLDDSHSHIPEQGLFEHRHDQSIFSCLRKINEATVWEDTSYPPFHNSDSFFWSARRR